MGDAREDNVAWSYEQPVEPVAGIKDYIAFYRNRVEIMPENDAGN